MAELSHSVAKEIGKQKAVTVLARRALAGLSVSPKGGAFGRCKYMFVEQVIDAHERYQINLMRPVLDDTRWQSL